MQRSHILRRLFWALGIGAGLFLLATAALVFAGLHDHIGKADVALVLGNKVEPDGTPSARLRARLDRTLELHRAGCFPTIIVSGGTGDEGFDEALVMRDYLVAHGIPKDRIIVDREGGTTFASARNTLEITRQMNLRSVFVISQYFHLPRARMALKRFGLAEIYSAHAHFFEIRDLYSSPREVLGYVKYLFRRFDAGPQNPS